MMFYTADEHYAHRNIIKYCNRPFQNEDEMDETMANRHNSKVTNNDTTVHGGDFTLISNTELVFKKYIYRLNGSHIFIRGSHDKWMGKEYHEIWTKTINKQHIVVCHYAMLVWPRSHYNSWLLFGHSHGALNDLVRGKCHDIGVDNNNFYPLSEDEIFDIMKSKPDNFNLVKGERE